MFLLVVLANICVGLFLKDRLLIIIFTLSSSDSVLPELFDSF